MLLAKEDVIKLIQSGHDSLHGLSLYTKSVGSTNIYIAIELVDLLRGIRGAEVSLLARGCTPRF